MLYDSPYRYKKKSSKKPIVFIFLVLALAASVFYFRNEIRGYVSGDRKIILEKEKSALQKSILSDKLKALDVEKFQEDTEDYYVRNIDEGLASLYRSYAYYYRFLISGFEFNGPTLLRMAYGGIENFVNSDRSYMPIVEDSRRFALRAKALDPDLSGHANLSYILFFSELLEHKRNPTTLAVQYEKKPEDLDSEFLPGYLFCSLLNSIQTGNPASMNRILGWIREDKALQLSEREIQFLEGLAAFSGKEYVKSLQILRSVRTQNQDYITTNSEILEARIFSQQNLSGRALGILENLYNRAEDRQSDIAEEIKKLLKEHPNLRSNVL